MKARLLKWHEVGKKTYETGVDRAVLYPAVDGAYPKGVAWSGVSAFNENPSGAEPTPIYADNKKYLNLFSVEEFGATLEAFTYPKEFEACDGSAELMPGVFIGQQERQGFGFAYRTLIGNDTEGTAHGYKIHLVYGCMASPSDKSHGTVNESPDLDPFSWEITTTPVEVEGHKATATLTLDSTVVGAEKMAAIEEILYGVPADGETPAVEARLPLPDEILSILAA